jgi:hypothetical protein
MVISLNSFVFAAFAWILLVGLDELLFSWYEETYWNIIPNRTWAYCGATPVAVGGFRMASCVQSRCWRKKIRDLSRERESSEQFVWLNRRYGETETQLSRSAITPSIRVKMQ